MVGEFMNMAYDPMLVMFASLACLWAVWQGVKLALGTSDMTWAATQFVFMFFGLGMLVGLQYGLANMVYTATTTLMFGIPGLLMDGGGTGDAVTTMVSNMEEGFMRPFNMAKTMIEGSGWFDKFGVVLFACALIVPFVLMMAQFIIHVALGLFRIMMVCIMAPYVISLSAFPFGRDKITVGVSTLLTSVLTLVSVTLVFQLVLAGVVAVIKDGSELSSNVMDPDTWPQYIMGILLAWSGVALIGEAASLAGTLAQVTLNGASSGALTGSAANQAKATAKGAVGGVKGAYKAGELAVSGGAAVGRKLRDIYAGKGGDDSK
ncbi:hypothetical protein ACQU0X_30145 [Pseudovibrio ascidiaceicola]|uniref:hypothetical protein n=1 Tax=Pseudovibrio ascidiaceicola TaxID=285279 RepID=UPI003D3600F1